MYLTYTLFCVITQLKNINSIKGDGLMKNNKIKINIILILVCIFLSVCTVCINVIIPKRLIQISNDRVIVDEDIYESTYGDVFYAKIEKIERKDNTNHNNENYNGIRYGTIYVKGLDVNDINHRGERSFSIDDDIKFFWKHKEIKLLDLREGQNVAITSIGYVYEGGTGYLTKVARVTVLDDKL